MNGRKNLESKTEDLDNNECHNSKLHGDNPQNLKDLSELGQKLKIHNLIRHHLQNGK